jgi:putative oxidoreductase
LLAQALFAASLFLYFWASGLTKLGDGAIGFLFPAAGAYVQILPKAMEMVGYDPSELSLWQHTVVLEGTLAEFIYSVCITLGIFTRLIAPWYDWLHSYPEPHRPLWPWRHFPSCHARRLV